MKPAALKSYIRPVLTVSTPLGGLNSGGVLINTQGAGLDSYRTLNVCALVLLIDGAGRYRDSWGEDRRLAPGDCLCYPAGCPHQYGPEPGDTWSEVFLTVKGPAFDAWFATPKSGARPDRVRRLGDADLWLPRWLKILGMPATTPNELVKVLAEVHLLLNDVLRPPEGEARAMARLDETRHLVASWPARSTPDWERLAAMCHSSYETWRKTFRRAYGEPPARYRRRMLMEQAAELMRRSSLTNEQLAEHFGCADAFHFSKMFKSVHGRGPAEFRRRG